MMINLTDWFVMIRCSQNSVGGIKELLLSLTVGQTGANWGKLGLTCAKHFELQFIIIMQLAPLLVEHLCPE